MTFALCLVTAALGCGLARQKAATGSKEDAAWRRDQPPASPVAGIKDFDAGLRGVAAHCDTMALWQWLAGQELFSSSRMIEAVIGELLDREGVGAVQKALHLEQPDLREWLSKEFLEAWAKRDIWGAYDLYQEHRHEFGSRWEGNMPAVVLAAACEISADKVIGMLPEVSDDERFRGGRYATDFDFVKLVAFFEARQDVSAALDFVVPEWAARSPAEAAAWFVQAGWKDSHDAESADSAAMRVIDGVAESHSFGRMKGLEALAQLPAESKDKAWRSLGNRAANSNPQRVVIESKLLEAADAMGSSEEFLASALLGTRGEIALDDSWSQVPPEQRPAILAHAMADWEEKDPSPSAAKARESWRKVVEKSWRK